MNRFLILTLALAMLLAPAAQAAPLSGTKSVGPTGDYPSLTAAIADIQAESLGGALVLELEAAYLSAVETFPLTVPALNGASAVNTLTLRPATGATALSISSADTTAATVDLNGAQFVTIDGRPGGVGSHAGSGGGAASQLTIENTSTSGVALRFNEANGNIVRYLTLRGVNTSTSSGVVVFTATGSIGSDNNTIDHCDLGDGASTPANGLYAVASGDDAARDNSGNTVSNCNIFNFYSSGAGVWLAAGNTDWSITGNSFYQTASRASVTATVRAIFVSNVSGNNFTVTGNFIGGSAPNAGGAAWTISAGAAYRFVGIHLLVGTTTPSSVQGNTIANMVWTTSSATSALPGIWTGIYVQAGSANLGTVTGNTIGSGTGTGSISVTSPGTAGAATSHGIGSSSSGTVAIANNTIGSITVNGTGTTSTSFTGISVTAGANTITGNTVGSTTTANSLNAATSSTSSFNQFVTGILSSSTGGASITGNTVANLNNNTVGTVGGAVRGIVTSAGVNTITGNTVRNFATTSANPNLTTSQSVFGIIDTSTAAGQTVSQNTVHSLANTAASAAVSVTGIYFAGPTSGVNVIARNLVHSLAVSSTSASSQLKGMEFAAGTFTAQNNMVRVGLKADGTSTAGASGLRGIFDIGTTAGRNFYHNSVYLGGTETSGAADTFAFLSGGVSNARTFRNNLFVNARGNSGGTGKHYAVYYGGTTANPTGLTAGGNIFYVSGTGGVLGFYNFADRTTLAAWQAATGQDATSLNANPLYVNPIGTAATVDLHLQAASPANNAGLALAAVTDDFDGDTRSATTPDIGADEIAGSAAPVLDFGDAPDPLVATSGQYPTLLANNGARHTIPGGGATLYLGAVAPDSEADGQPNATATGDDATGTDDEDGVAFPAAFPQNLAKNVTVTVTGAGGTLNAWIDWNQNGLWTDAGEQVATDLAVSAGPNVLSVTAPAGATVGTTFARFRLSTQTGLAPTGAASDGEVEDYKVTVVLPLVASAGSDPTICAGGSVGIGGAPTASGGSAPYSYSWNNGGSLNNTGISNPTASPAATTIYTVTVTDANGDTAQDSVTVNVVPAQTATVGSAQTICANGTTAGLGGNTPTSGTGAWSVVSGGTGTFSSASDPNATFTHTGGTGPITLRWTISNAPCPNSTADVVVTINQPPTVASVGGAQTICANGTTTGLGGNTPTSGTGAWSVESGGTGTFSSASDANATFTHTGGTGPITLRWTISNAPCPNSTADVVVTITQPPTAASVGSAQTICANGTTTGLGGNTPTVGTGAWSVESGGTGTFSSASDANATFTHTGGTGPITLRWTISNAPCPNSTADVVITINQPPTVASVGSAQTICANGTTTGLGGNTPTVGTGAWSVESGGTGTFSSASDANATFTHTGGTGPITLRWTISNAPCPNSTADVVITINQPPTTATVGSAQTICANGTTAGLGGNTPTIGTGAWSVESGGTGTFSSASDANATFTHTGGTGPITLRWTISNAPCPNSTADVVITITQPPTTASNGGNQSIPPSGTTAGLGGNTPSVGTGAWSVVSGGTGTFAPNAGTPNATFTHTGGAGPITLRWTISNSPCPDSTADLIVTLLAANASPVAGSDTLGTKKGVPVNAPIPKLLANDSDADGGTLSITAVSPLSANGGTVVLGAGVISYTPPVNFTGSDSFTYTLSDGQGGTAPGTVNVTVDPDGPSLNFVSITVTPTGKLIRFAGIPGQSYMIQYADATTGPWLPLSPPITASSTGVIEFEDTTVPAPPVRFYRTIAP